MCDASDTRPSSPPGPPNTADGSSAVKIVAIIAGVLLTMFLVCGGIFVLVVYSVRSAAEKNMQAFLESAKRNAEEARTRHEKWVDETRAEWAQKDADQGAGKRFAEGFLTALREHRFADAFRETTAAFREQFPSEKELEQLTRAHAALHRQAMLFDEDFGQQSGARQRFSFTATEGEMLDMKMVKVVVVVEKEGLNWKADELTVSERVFPGMPER